MAFVRRETPNGLERRVWLFNWIENRLNLVGYAIEIRETKRHKFRQVKEWRSHYPRHQNTILEPRDIPADVLREVLDEYPVKICIAHRVVATLDCSKLI